MLGLLHSWFGEAFATWLLGDTSGDLTPEQLQVLGTVVAYVSEQLERSPGLPPALAIGSLNHYGQPSGKTTFNLLRKAATGEEYEAPTTTGDQVVDALNHVAVDVYGEFLIAPYPSFGPSMSSSFTSPSGRSLVQAVCEDPSFPFESPELGSGIPFSRSTGLALYAGYEQAFKRISWKSGQSSWRCKLAYASLVGVQLSNLQRFDGGAQLAAVGESTFRGARFAMTAEVQRRREMLEPKIEPPAIDTDQIQWSIVTGDGLVTLKGDLPNGFPTETWIDDRLLEREPSGVFSWDLDAGLPTPVSLICKHTDCLEVRREIELWEGLASNASTPIGVIRTRAYAQAARDRESALGC
jgi:hypothetical protein